jgi:hypothetical protein
MVLAGAAPKRQQVSRLSRTQPTSGGVTLTRAVLYALSAERLASGTAKIHQSADGWMATLSKLDRPGAITRAYFTDGIRNVFVHLPDGRRALARITGTSYSAGHERVCELRGLGHFS